MMQRILRLPSFFWGIGRTNTDMLFSVQSLRRLFKQARAWRDFLRFRREYAWLAAPVPPVSKGEVLLLSFTDWAPRLQLESLIAKALALRGYTPVILTNRVYRRAQRYFRACGVRRLAPGVSSGVWRRAVADAERWTPNDTPFAAR